MEVEWWGMKASAEMAETTVRACMHACRNQAITDRPIVTCERLMYRRASCMEENAWERCATTKAGRAACKGKRQISEVQLVSYSYRTVGRRLRASVGAGGGVSTKSMGTRLEIGPCRAVTRQDCDIGNRS
jgi:hypothetical protein